MPRVIDLSRDPRRAGDIGPGQVYVGPKRDGWRASRWANPFRVDDRDRRRDGDRAEVLAKYRKYLINKPELVKAMPELRGKDLLAWDEVEASVLLRLANPGVPRS